MSITIEIPSSLAEEIQSALPRSNCKDEKDFVISVIQAHLVVMKNRRTVMGSHLDQIRTGFHLSFDYSKIDSVLKIARLELILPNLTKEQIKKLIEQNGNR